MSDEHDPGRPADAVGSVGEEAMKLFGALADLARQHAGDAAAFAHDVGEHIATDAAECRYCPVCRVIHTVRQTSPEVKAHLMVAASSLLQAAAALVDAPPSAGEGGGAPRGPHVQRIDLDETDDPESP